MSRIRNWLKTTNSFDDWTPIYWTYSKSTQTALRTEKVTYSLAEPVSGCSPNPIAAVFAKTIEFALAWDSWSFVNTAYSIRQKPRTRIRSQHAPLISKNLKLRMAYHSAIWVLLEGPNGRHTRWIDCLFWASQLAELSNPFGNFVKLGMNPNLPWKIQCRFNSSWSKLKRSLKSEYSTPHTIRRFDLSIFDQPVKLTPECPHPFASWKHPRGLPWCTTH